MNADRVLQPKFRLVQCRHYGETVQAEPGLNGNFPEPGGNPYSKPEGMLEQGQWVRP
jgi:hypothetical protein